MRKKLTKLQRLERRVRRQLARKAAGARWSKTTPEARSAYGTAMAEARWAKAREVKAAK